MGKRLCLVCHQAVNDSMGHEAVDDSMGHQAVDAADTRCLAGMSLVCAALVDPLRRIAPWPLAARVWQWTGDCLSPRGQPAPARRRFRRFRPRGNRRHDLKPPQDFRRQNLSRGGPHCSLQRAGLTAPGLGEAQAEAGRGLVRRRPSGGRAAREGVGEARRRRHCGDGGVPAGNNFPKRSIASRVPYLSSRKRQGAGG